MTGDDGPGPGVMISFGERTTSMNKGVTQDTYIDESVPTLNFGVDPELSVAANPAPLEHSLVRFDLTAITPETAIASATLELSHFPTGDEVVGSISLFTAAEIWIAGTGLGGVATANWTQRVNSTAWTTAGGTVGVALAPGGVPTFPLVVPLDRDAVQAWIDDPNANFGLIMRPTVSTSGMHYHFHSANSTSVDLRPELVIELAP